jgi:hypothetical protein
MLEEKEEPRTLVTRETQTSITGASLPRTLAPYIILSKYFYPEFFVSKNSGIARN